MPFRSHHERAKRAKIAVKSVAAALIAAVAVIAVGGCTENSSHEWAQTAPIIKADATAAFSTTPPIASADVNLGALVSDS